MAPLSRLDNCRYSPRGTPHRTYADSLRTYTTAYTPSHWSGEHTLPSTHWEGNLKYNADKKWFFYLYLYPGFCMDQWTHGPTYKGVPNWFVVSRKSHDGFLRTIFMKKKMICRDPSSVKYNFCGLISSINKIKCLKFYTQIENSGFLHMPCTLERRTSR